MGLLKEMEPQISKTSTERKPRKKLSIDPEKIGILRWNINFHHRCPSQNKKHKTMENSKINKKNILAILPNSSVGENQNQSYNVYAVR